MCGIAGKVAPGGRVEQALVEEMCAAIEHRGPDSRGVFVDEGVGLGIQRLRIIDLETGDQPIFNEDESVVVVLNGEIYNYRELRADLERAGHRFATKSDTEVIVHLYEDHGERCVEHLRGMFGFALWDRRARRLLLARDRVGKKPLFYSHRDGQLWFGSEAKAILRDPAIPREVNADAIDSFLQYAYVPHPMSAFSALAKLPPAHTLTWEDGRVSTRRYWRLSYRAAGVPTGEEEMRELIRDQLLEATRLRLRSDVPLGAFLSGGIDSAAVVAAMARESAGQVKTFSIGFDVEEYDETRHARQVAELYDTEHHEFTVAPTAMSVLPRLVWHYGEPFADPSAIPSFHLAEVTRRHVTVALNGDGGDESFAGYTRYYAHRFAHRLRHLPAPAARAVAELLDRTGAQGSSRRAVRSAWWLSHALQLEPADAYAKTMAVFPPDERADLYTPEFRDSLARSGGPSARSFTADAFVGSDGKDVVERLQDVDVHTYLPGGLLVKMDIATMAHSLEVRSPFLDHRLMESAAALPSQAKLDGSATKRILKDALRPWLPESILFREKMGFSVPVDAWFRGELRELPAEVLLDPAALGRGMFQESAVRGLIDDHRTGRADNGGRIWALLQLELWQRSYVDSVRTAPLALDVA